MARRTRKSTPLKIGWFSTGRGQGSRNLLTSVCSSIQCGELNARIEFVFCSRERGEDVNSDAFLKLADDFSIPVVCHSYEKFRSSGGFPPAVSGKPLPAWRMSYDQEVMKKLESFNPDVCALAGYMLIVGPEMCRRYNMLNLHPAAPGGPAGTWREVIWKLIDMRAASTGVMIHLVTPELDKGPVVTYCTFPIVGGEFDRYWTEIAGMSGSEVKTRQGESNRLFQLIRRHGAARELALIVSTLKAFSEGRVTISGGEVLDSAGQVVHGHDLSGEIDEAVKEVLSISRVIPDPKGTPRRKI
ncbi:MAG: phosphoglycerate transporter [Chloroflexi bacterium]|nr:phosphoglycerate transporter [Chloroflexota bacterium]